MKKFETLEVEEQKIKKEEQKNDNAAKRKKNILPIILIIAGVIIIGFICFKLFFSTKSNSSQGASENVYEINNGASDTTIEEKTYKAGQTATIDTSYGSYNLCVTDAIIEKRAPDRGGELYYKITYQIDNKNFDDSTGGALVDPSSLTVYDDNDMSCAVFDSFYDDEMVNAYEVVPKGKKMEKTGIYAVADSKATKLEVMLLNRGVKFIVPISNVEEFNDNHKEEEISLGTPVSIEDAYGHMTITVDDVRVDNSLLYDENEDNLVVLDFQVENIDYTYDGDGTDVLDWYIMSELLKITDDDGNTLEPAEVSMNTKKDGDYEFYPIIKQGKKVKLCSACLVDKDCESITINFNNGKTITVKL